MLSNIPTSVKWVAGIVVAILIIYAASEYLDAATGLLPGGEGGG